MKKVLATVLAALMVLSYTACTKTGDKETGTDTSETALAILARITTRNRSLKILSQTINRVLHT